MAKLTFNLTATFTDDNGTVSTRPCTVTVDAPPPAPPPPPVITSFTINPSSITLGQSSALAWTTTGGTSASIFDGTTTVSVDPVSGNLAITPSQAGTTTYTLTVINGVGSVSSIQSLTVIGTTPPNNPTITSFTSNLNDVPPGTTVGLSYASTNANSGEISWVGVDGTNSGGASGVLPNGNSNYTVLVTTTFTLKVIDTDTGNFATADLVVTVDGGGGTDPTSTFQQTFGQSALYRTQPLSTHYDTTNADVVTINGSSTVLPGTVDGKGNPVAIGPWPLSGDFGLQLTGPSPFSATLVATQSITGKQTSPLTLSVAIVENNPVPPEPAIPAPIVRGPTRPGIAGRTLLDLSKLQLVGVHGLDSSTLDIGTTLSGFTYRHVNGKRQWFTTGAYRNNSPLYEYLEPDTLITPAQFQANPDSLPIAKTVKVWGDIYGGIKGFYGVDGNPNSYGLTGGLQWRDGTIPGAGTLLYTFGVGYNTGVVSNSLAIITFNADGTTNPNTPWKGGTTPPFDPSLLPTGCGPWGAPAPVWQANKTGGGMLSGLIPSYFANTHLNGKDVMVGFGGNNTISDSDSWGLAAFAINNPTGTPPGTINYIRLCDYPFFGDNARQQNRLADYTCLGNTFWQPPQNGIGFWCSMDNFFSCAAWIDDGTHHGILGISQRGTGQTAYVIGSPVADYGENSFSLFDPADFAAVAQGTLPPTAIDFCRFQDVGSSFFPIRPHYDPNNPNAPRNLQPVGAAWVPEVNRLYVKCENVYQPNPGINQPWSPMIFVYRIAA